MFLIFLLLLYAAKCAQCFGYDGGSDEGACTKHYRTSRMHQPPCDLTKKNYCTSAGKMYPWHAVKRFINENQGLMKRMYGYEPHIKILRKELQNQEEEEQRFAKQLDLNNELYENETPRYLQEEIILNTKFIYNHQIPPKFHQQQTSSTSTSTSTAPSTTAPPTTTSTTTTTTTTTTTPTTKSPETTTFNVTTDFLTTTDVVLETTTDYEEITTQNLKKPSEMLFQDTFNNNKHVNLKLHGVNACPVKEEVVAPFWANNTRGEVLALLNLYPFEQYVHWEKCTFEYRQMYCREGCRCEQQYRLHRLLAYDPNNECRGIFSDWFRFPSCCVCKCYDMPPEFRVTSRSPRSGGNGKTSSSTAWFLKKKTTGKLFKKNDTTK